MPLSVLSLRLPLIDHVVYWQRIALGLTNLLNFQILKSVGFALRALKMGKIEVTEKAKENRRKNTPNPFIKKTDFCERGFLAPSFSNPHGGAVTSAYIYQDGERRQRR